MTKRLRELRDSADADVAFAALLAAAKRPTAPDPFLRERVRVAIQRKPRRSARKGGLRTLMLTVTTLAILGFVSVASAMFGRHILSKRLFRRHGAVEQPASSRPSLPTYAPPLFPKAAPRPLPLNASPPAAPVTSASRFKRPSKSEHEAGESLLMVPAFLALHREQDPERALALLDRYFAKYPSGGLLEEAIALRLEALFAKKDPQAGQVASDYLRTYPLGRFRQIAQRARTQFP